jgi:FHS family glucose/mannose:H+ symporter-like MFS transporter
MPDSIEMDSATSSHFDFSSTPNPKLEWFLLHAGFVVIGVITTSLGPLLPMFSKQWGLSDAQAGSFFPAQYCVSLVGVIATSWLLPRFGFSKVLGVGFLFLTVGMGFVGVNPWLLTGVFVSLNGFGYGLTNPTTNLRGTQLPSSNVAAAVSLLNFSWGVGAVACPFLVAALVPKIGIHGFGICMAVCTLAIALGHFFREAPAVVAAAKRPKHSWEDWMQELRHGASIPLVVLFFLYVGTEAGTGGWVAALEKRMPVSGHASALTIAPSVFYGFLLLGRGLAPLGLRRFSTVAISLSGLLSAIVGTATIGLAHSTPVLLVGTAMAGIGCAPQYPILVTWLARMFRGNSDWLGALFFSAGSLGGGVLPQLVGSIATQSHSLRAGFLVPLIASIIMFFLALQVRPHTR